MRFSVITPGSSLPRATPRSATPHEVLTSEAAEAPERREELMGGRGPEAAGPPQGLAATLGVSPGPPCPRWTSRVQIPSPAPLFTELCASAAVSRRHAWLPERCEKRCDDGRPVGAVARSVRDVEASAELNLASSAVGAITTSSKRALRTRLALLILVPRRRPYERDVASQRPSAGSRTDVRGAPARRDDAGPGSLLADARARGAPSRGGRS